MFTAGTCPHYFAHLMGNETAHEQINVWPIHHECPDGFPRVLCILYVDTTN